MNNQIKLYLKKYKNNDSLQASIQKLWSMWKAQKITTNNYFKIVSNIYAFEKKLNNYIEKAII